MKLFLILLSISSVLAVQADIQITLQNGEQQLSTISSNGNKARLDDAGTSGYVIVDFVNQLFLMVEPERGQVMQMDASNATSAADITQIKGDLKLQNKGKGPTIAGYPTTQYMLMVNNSLCATIFASREVLEIKGVSELFEAMSNMQSQTQKMMGSYRSQMDACTQADLQMSKTFQTTGAPLRLLDENGQLESEVVKIDTRKNLAPGYYDIPSTYQVVKVQDKMDQLGRQSQQLMQEMQNNMPDMNQLMQQLQQSGQIKPEMMEQMKKMEEMLKKQYQQ